MARPKSKGFTPSDEFRKDFITTKPDVAIPAIDVGVVAYVEPAAIVPEVDVTAEMKQEIPLNTPETAVPVVEQKSFKDRMAECMNHFDTKYFEAKVKEGCDYKSYGDWQKAYCGLFDRVFGIRGKAVLDAGSAYGAIGHGFKQFGAKAVTCVDISKHATATRVFDDVNYVLAPLQMMKAVESNSQDLIHASYVMNSIEACDLDVTFAELKRVMKDGGKVVIIMNFGKDVELSKFDVRHSFETVLESAKKAGFKEIEDVVNKFRKVDDDRYGFITSYNWGMMGLE